MQREIKGRNDLFDMGDPFSIFGGMGGFGSNRSMMPGLFSGRDPFDDPFFTHPFDSMFETSVFDQNASLSNTAQDNKTKGIVIEELDSDHEGEKEDKGNREMLSDSSKEPSIEHPDDDVDDGNSNGINYKNQYSKVEGTQPQSHSFGFQTCKVTYGGIDGAYYTSTRTRRTGKDGVVIEDSKEADRTTGQATHRISRGIHDKGHSVTRKLNSDGKVDMLQTLHNLNEDELGGFEEAWKGNANKHLPGWSDGFDMLHGAGCSGDEQKGGATWSGWALPSSEQIRNAEATTSVNEARARTSGPAERTKKVVRINIE